MPRKMHVCVSLCDGRIVRHSSLEHTAILDGNYSNLELFSHVSHIDPFDTSWSRMLFSITTSAQVHRFVCIQWHSSENYTLNETPFEDIVHCLVSVSMCVYDPVIKQFLIFTATHCSKCMNEHFNFQLSDEENVNTINTFSPGTAAFPESRAHTYTMFINRAMIFTKQRQVFRSKP